MDWFEPARQAAAQFHAKLVLKGADDARAWGLIDAALKDLDLELVWLEKGATALDGARAFLDDQTGTILAADDGDEVAKAILIAHEIGHAVLHIGASPCLESDIDACRSAEAPAVGLQRVEDYGARERRELQANVFAREFLLPRAIAGERRLAGQTPRTVATAAGLPLDLVRQQMLDALLLPLAGPTEIEPESETAQLPLPDPSQDRAVAHRDTPFLLQAGPGTGKTRTLVRRVLSLLDEDVEAEAILALTFSNRAAGELSERLLTAAPEKAPRLWVGTFHGFGLDLVRRYHDRLGLSADPPLFDRSDAIAVLDQILPTLSLVHYRNLWDPELILREMLTAISRAKDEMVGPQRYRQLAEAMRQTASDEDERVVAEKALEVARVYELYEQALQDRGAVDFGDLILRPTRLLEDDPVIRDTVRLRHRHLLIDEYQDINRASARLVKAVAGAGQRLWVVGDARQSIYRFRGASPANMSQFTDDYPGGVVDRLEVNYRSHKEVVDTFTAFASTMTASRGMLPLELEARRGASGDRPTRSAFIMPDDEIEGVAAGVKGMQSQGVRLRDQAVLCRSNGRLNEIAAGLEARGIAVLHLGSLFERDEVRDLLALLSLAVDPFGSGLVKVAAHPRYAIPLNDVGRLVRALAGADRPALRSLPTLVSTAGLSDAGREGLTRLARDLTGLKETTSPWSFLADYLLERTSLACDLAQADSVAGRMRGVAVWQLLNFLREGVALGSGPPIQRALDRIRHLVLFNEERDLRQVPSAVLHLDAVRLMTVHGSKGLEFRGVHLPGLTVAGFPSSNRGDRCPPPRHLIDGIDGQDPKAHAKTSHTAEEECLFFVALSRARDHLALYHPTKQPGGNNRSPSPFLDSVAGLVDLIAQPPQMTLPGGAVQAQSITITWPTDWSLTDAHLESYDGCPRRFFYTHVLGLGGRRRMTPFGQTHDCLHEALRLLQAARAEGIFDPEALAIQLEEIWCRRGPTEHGYEAEYRALCERLLANAVRADDGGAFAPPMPLTVSLGNGSLVVQPAEMIVRDGVTILRRTRTGYKRSDEYDKLSYTLYHLAGRANFGQGYRVEAHHLTDDTLEPVDVTERKQTTRRERAAEKIAAISAGRFPPVPDPVSCPRCPHFFICAATPNGPLNLV